MVIPFGRQHGKGDIVGNHQAGRAMGLTAAVLLATRTNQTALELLDIICEPYRGCDAEFESQTGDDFGNYDDPDGPIGALIIEAFGGGRDWRAEFDTAADLDEFHEAWWGKFSRTDTDFRGQYDGPYGQFRKRYEFC